MPFFSRSSDATNTNTTTTDAPPKRRSTLFGRGRSPSPSKATHNTTTTSQGNSGRNFLSRHGNNEDASITAARERVLSAEAAERDADKALVQARLAVREARDHVKALEKEAAEEARLAKIKQNQAKSISKRAKPLGRHDRA